MPERPVRVRRDLGLEELRRDIPPAVHDVPAAELDLAQLRVVELVPVHVALPVELLVVPAQELEVVIRWVLLHPLDVAEVFDARLALRAPELRRPGVDADV